MSCVRVQNDYFSFHRVDKIARTGVGPLDFVVVPMPLAVIPYRSDIVHIKVSGISLARQYHDGLLVPTLPRFSHYNNRFDSLVENIPLPWIGMPSEPGWVSSLGCIVGAIREPIPPMLRRIAGEESSRAGIVIPMPEQHQSGIGVGLIAERSAVPERAFPGSRRGIEVAKRIEGLRGQNGLAASGLRFGVLEPGMRVGGGA